MNAYVRTLAVQAGAEPSAAVPTPSGRESARVPQGPEPPEGGTVDADRGPSTSPAEGRSTPVVTANGSVPPQQRQSDAHEGADEHPTEHATRRASTLTAQDVGAATAAAGTTAPPPPPPPTARAEPVAPAGTPRDVGLRPPSFGPLAPPVPASPTKRLARRHSETHEKRSPPAEPDLRPPTWEHAYQRVVAWVAEGTGPTGERPPAATAFGGGEPEVASRVGVPVPGPEGVPAGVEQDVHLTIGTIHVTVEEPVAPRQRRTDPPPPRPPPPSASSLLSRHYVTVDW